MLHAESTLTFSVWQCLEMQTKDKLIALALDVTALYNRETQENETALNDYMRWELQTGFKQHNDEMVCTLMD